MESHSTPPTVVDLEQGFASFTDHFSPRIAAELNGQMVKLVKFAAPFVWHSHADADEMFLVWRGRFRMEFRAGAVEVGPGQFLVVPRGVEHRPVATAEVELLLFEPAGTLNTGDAPESDRTVREPKRLE